MACLQAETLSLNRFVLQKTTDKFADAIAARSKLLEPLVILKAFSKDSMACGRSPCLTSAAPS
jgi:hypothetical protein